MMGPFSPKTNINHILYSITMAEVITNATDINEILMPIINELLTEQFSWVSTFIQALGILLIIYIIYFIASAFFRFKDRKRMRRIEEKLDELNEKVAKLSKKSKKKRKS